MEFAFRWDNRLTKVSANDSYERQEATVEVMFEDVSISQKSLNPAGRLSLSFSGRPRVDFSSSQAADHAHFLLRSKEALFSANRRDERLTMGLPEEFVLLRIIVGEQDRHQAAPSV